MLFVGKTKRQCWKLIQEKNAEIYRLNKKMEKDLAAYSTVIYQDWKRDCRKYNDNQNEPVVINVYVDGEKIR